MPMHYHQRFMDDNVFCGAVELRRPSLLAANTLGGCSAGAALGCHVTSLTGSTMLFLWMRRCDKSRVGVSAERRVACIRLERCKAEQVDRLINPATPLLRQESPALLQGTHAQRPAYLRQWWTLFEVEEETGSSDAHTKKHFFVRLFCYIFLR